MAFSNRDRLKRKLRALPAEAEKAVKAQLEKEANDLAELIRRRVPKRTGALRDSITVVPGDKPLSVKIKAGGPTTTKKARKGVKEIDFAKAKITGGSRGEYDYARGVEFGTSEQPAQPFFWPSYRQRKRQIRRRVSTAAKKAVRKKAT